MSALPPIADIRQRIEHVCFVPLADIRRGQSMQADEDPEDVGVLYRAIATMNKKVPLPAYEAKCRRGRNLKD